MKKLLLQPIKSRTFSLAKRAGEFFFPALCIVCDNPLSSKNSWLCLCCLDRLRENRVNRKACPRCSQNIATSTCTCDIAWDYSFEKIYSIYDFNETIRQIAHLIKYKGKKRLALELGILSNGAVPGEFFTGYEICIPVPLHSSRMRSRGFNQSEWFARGILDNENNRVPLVNDLLLRTRKTGTQTKLNRSERKKNLEGAFVVPQEKRSFVSGKRVLLVDDVVTTGATTEACTLALLEGGCLSVGVLSVARD